jgi:hypothetical protein
MSEKKPEIRGLGDAIKAVTGFTGIDRVVKFTTNAVGIEDCGCDERQEKLNDPELWINKLVYGSK